MEISIPVTIGVVGVVCTIAFSYISYLKGTKKEVKAESEEDGALKADMKYLIRRVDDILLEQKDTNKSINELAERVTRVEESAKQAHKRIDGLEEK
jgi:peptidoglycan hydrolase CwlO-like protein